MSFHFRCPACNAKLEAEDDWAGLETQCPQCSQNIKIVKPIPGPPPLPSTPSLAKSVSEQSDSTFDEDSFLDKVCKIKQIIFPAKPEKHSIPTVSSSGKCTCGKCHKEIDGAVEICPHCGITREWYRMGFEEEICGPFSEYDFKEDIKNGTMSAFDYVWKWGQNGWIQLGNSELKDSLWVDIPPTIQKRPEVDLEILLKMLTLLEVILATVVFFLCLHFEARKDDTITGLNVISYIFGIFWFISIFADGCILHSRKYDVGFSFLYWTPYYLLRRAKVLQYTPTLTPGYFGIYLFMPFVLTIALQLIYNTIR
jgi:hypothetical protein